MSSVLKVDKDNDDLICSEFRSGEGIRPLAIVEGIGAVRVPK